MADYIPGGDAEFNGWLLGGFGTYAGANLGLVQGDIDPTDPDGDAEVSEDCQPNGMPDECDFTRPLMASGDCNTNGIPDECDLADCPPEDPACQDCNTNGIPDECDIAGGTSLDENTNGIPDECEGGGQGGGSGQGGGGGSGGGQGGGGPGGSPTAGEESWPGDDGETDPDNEAAWAEFFAWFIVQDWGPDAEATGAEQHQMMVDKLEELGLPIADPWLWTEAEPEPAD